MNAVSWKKTFSYSALAVDVLHGGNVGLAAISGRYKGIEA